LGTCIVGQRRTTSWASARRAASHADGVERERRRPPEARVVGQVRRVGHVGRERPHRVAHTPGLRAELVGPLRSTGFRRLAGDVVDREQRHHGRGDRPLLVGRSSERRRGHRLQRRTGDRLRRRGVARPRLAGLGAQDPLLREVLPEAPQRIVLAHLVAEGIELLFDREELPDESPDVRRRREERLAPGDRGHALALRLPVRREAGVVLRSLGREPAIEDVVELGQLRRVVQVGVREPGDPEDERRRIAGRRRAVELRSGECLRLGRETDVVHSGGHGVFFSDGRRAWRGCGEPAGPWLRPA
jgi:hypothetical protein